jgi:glutathione S-transferase
MTITFYTNPMSRGRMVRWMLEEIGAPYETVLLDYRTTMKAPEYLAINPMGKVPAIRHGDTVITETAAIITYLADAFPDAGLAPAASDRARGEYLRWLFYTAGPLEQAMAFTGLGIDVPVEKIGMTGCGNQTMVADTLDGFLAGRQFVLGDRFSAADVYLGSALGFATRFGSIPMRPAFGPYLAGVLSRPASVRASSIDDALLAAGKDRG